MRAAPLIVTPIGPTAESLRLGTRAVATCLDRLPEAQLAPIENERDGTTDILHPASDAAAAYRDVVLPLIEEASWQVFEAAGVGPVGAFSMPVAEIMTLTGLPRLEAKIARARAQPMCRTRGTRCGSVGCNFPATQRGFDSRIVARAG